MKSDLIKDQPMPSNQKDLGQSPTKRKYKVLHKTAEQCLKNQVYKGQTLAYRLRFENKFRKKVAHLRSKDSGALRPVRFRSLPVGALPESPKDRFGDMLLDRPRREKSQSGSDYSFESE